MTIVLQPPDKRWLFCWINLYSSALFFLHFFFLPILWLLSLHSIHLTLYTNKNNNTSKNMKWNNEVIYVRLRTNIRMTFMYAWLTGSEKSFGIRVDFQKNQKIQFILHFILSSFQMRFLQKQNSIALMKVLYLLHSSKMKLIYKTESGVNNIPTK